MLKKRLTLDEKYGLSPEEIADAERYLKKHKTAGALDKQQAMPFYELFLLGYSIEEINSKFPKVPRGQLALTAALNQWPKDRDKLVGSIYDRIRARVFRSTVEQVEFLTDMVSVATAENAHEMRRYLLDPKNNPTPSMKINNIKEYQLVIDMMTKVTDSMKKTVEEDANPKSKSKRIKSPPVESLTNKDESLLLERLAEVDDE